MLFRPCGAVLRRPDLRLLQPPTARLHVAAGRVSGDHLQPTAGC